MAGWGYRGKGAEVSKQNQIDVLGDRLDELRDFVHGSDVGDFGLDDRLSAVHDQVVSLRDEVASLRRRVKDLENMTGKQAKATVYLGGETWKDGLLVSTADETQAKPEPPACRTCNGTGRAWEQTQGLPCPEAVVVPCPDCRVPKLLADRDEWKARAEKAEAEVADLQAQIRGVDACE